MDADERRRRMNVAHDEDDSFFLTTAAITIFSRELAFKAHDAEMAPPRGEISFCELADCGSGTHITIIEGVVLTFAYGDH